MDIEAAKIKQRMERRMSWMKQDAAARSDQIIKQQIEELQALFEMFVRKMESGENGEKMDSSREGNAGL